MLCKSCVRNFNIVIYIIYAYNIYCSSEIAQARPVLHTSLMQRMTDVLSRMLNDPATRAALSGGGEDSLEGVIEQPEGIQNVENNPESNAERSNDTVELNAEQSNISGTSGNQNRCVYICYTFRCLILFKYHF